MGSNLLLEQYSRYKKKELEESPYRCLLNADIELNPHQINAFCAAIQALKTGGIVLADEVGLGKTIEAGLVIDYVIGAGAKRILLSMPATLRKQWEVELKEKFNLSAIILDRIILEKDYYDWKTRPESGKNAEIVITSYDFASKLIKRLPKVKWDYVVIDEAHNLRNVFHNTKRAKKLYDLTQGIPKLLLTATPLQNSLSDLHGLVSFIDPRIFGSEKVFNSRFVEEQDYSELKKELLPVMYRTLRRDVSKYMPFKARKCVTVDFALTPEEEQLYDLVNGFLKRRDLYSIPNNNNSQLIIMVIRKLLASSSFALVQTFEVLKKRLEKLLQGTKSANAQEGFDLFWDYVEDEMDESDEEEAENEDLVFQKQSIQFELEEVNKIIALARSIKTNAKIQALLSAVNIAFDQQIKQGIAQKVVIFTESKRTQKYIAEELCKNGYLEDDIVQFNGEQNDPISKEIYRTWKVKNFGNGDYGRSVEFKHAIVDYFKGHAKVLIVTDAGSEGLNLQFCNTIINYDLPWNPQKIEQRIGRCHRYGQQNDVVAINLLNTTNVADRRVYEILSHKFELFEGVFGASDIALGVLESGVGFEKRILEIYQSCCTEKEFTTEFDKLSRKLDSKNDKDVKRLRTLLLTESPESKGVSLDNTKKNIDKYLKEVAFWNEINEPEMDGNLYYWQIDDWGEKIFASHGTLFLGAFCNNTETLFPVLLLCDEDGKYIDFEENEIVEALETADDSKIRFFKPSEEEYARYGEIYDRLTEEMTQKYKKSIDPVLEYNKNKLENWCTVQILQYIYDLRELETEVNKLFEKEGYARNELEKKDILKEIEKKKKHLDKMKDGLEQKIADIKNQTQQEIEEYRKQFEIRPILLINIVLKF